MAAIDITGIIEAVSEAVVFLEPDDLNGLADIHSYLEEVDAWANDQGHERTSRATTALRDIVEQIILQEHDDPHQGLALLAKAISCMQQVVRDGSRYSQADYPEELGIARSTGGDETADEGESSNGEIEYAFAVQLPVHVDEAIFSEFLTRQVGVLEEIESAALEIEQGKNDAALGVLSRHLHTLKGEAALLGLNDIEHLCHVTEDLLERESPSEVSDRLLALKDWLMSAFDAYAGKGIGPDPPATMEKILQEGLSTGDYTSPDALEVPTTAPSVSEAPAKDTADHASNILSSGPLTGDPELIADFVVEAMEHLDTSDIQLLTLETDPHNLDAINTIFRAFHTIKGVCGFIALEDMMALAHESENLLDLARKDSLVLEGPCLDIVFDAIDTLKHMLLNVREALENSTDVSTEPTLPALLAKIAHIAKGEMPVTVAASVQEDALFDTDAPQDLGEILVDMGSATKTAIEGALEAQQYADDTPRKLGEELQRKALVSGAQVEDALRIQRDKAPDEKLGEILVNMGAVGNVDLNQTLRKQTESSAKPRLGEVLVKSGEVPARKVSQALRTQKRQQPIQAGGAGASVPQGSAATIRETVKVDAHRLDQLVDMIGELVIAESMVYQSHELASDLSTELAQHVGQLDKITRELQEMAMGLRMVPVRSTFHKMARLVRDLARKTGKEVNFIMQGEDTELDKNVVDRISDPLVHMIRNSVDHGLEKNGDARRAAGKDTAGNVTLRAYHRGGNIHIEIADDGCGLDRKAILAKAQEHGLIVGDGESLSDKEVWQFIFEPGFSTAKQLTEVSGRGVGMDVVRRSVEALRGGIDIHSEAGIGSRFTIQLPLTLAIIDGMVIRVGAERYIIPTLSIVVSVRPSASDIQTLGGVAETMKLHGKIIPLIHLHKIFDVDTSIYSPTEGTVVVLENGEKRVGLLTDEIIGQQQIVIKSLGESLQRTKGIAGGAIMPDGKVGLILDIAGLVKLASEAKAV